MPENDFNLMAVIQDSPLVATRVVEVRPGTTITVRALTRDEWRRMRRRVERIKGSSDAKEQAADAGITNLLASAVVGWDNMTREVVGQLIPVDTSKLPEQLPFDKKNVYALLWHSTEFSNLVNSESEDLGAFAEAQEESARKN